MPHSFWTTAVDAKAYKLVVFVPPSPNYSDRVNAHALGFPSELHTLSSDAGTDKAMNPYGMHWAGDLGLCLEPCLMILLGAYHVWTNEERTTPAMHPALSTQAEQGHSGLKVYG